MFSTELLTTVVKLGVFFIFKQTLSFRSLSHDASKEPQILSTKVARITGFPVKYAIPFRYPLVYGLYLIEE